MLQCGFPSLFHSLGLTMLNAKTIKAKELRLNHIIVMPVNSPCPHATATSVAKFPNGQVMVTLAFPNGITTKAKYEGDKDVIILV